MTSKRAREVLSERPKSALYHYTSHRALVSILQSGEIWATNVSYLNDRAEFSHAIELAREIVTEELRNERDDARVEYLRAVEKALRLELTELASMVYVASFCEEPDSLTLWRGYCPEKAGYSFGYDWSQDTNDQICVTRCLYDKAQKHSVIKDFLDEFFSLSPEALRVGLALYGQGFWTQITDEREIRALQFAQRLTVIAPAFKDAAFRDEREWRVVYFKPTAAFQPEFRCGDRMLIPYARIPLRTTDAKLVISEITVGPTDHPQEARRSLEGFLNTIKDLTCRKVSVSTVPFRQV